MKKQQLIKKLLLVGILLLGAFFLYKYYIRPIHVQQKVLHGDRYQNRLTHLQAMEMEKGAIVFLGNSLTEYFDLSILGRDGIVNQGIAGDYSIGVLNRLGPILESQPRQLFLMIGVNDLLAGIEVEEVFSNYESILSKVKEHAPATEVCVQSLLPTSFEDGTFTDNKDINEKVLELNAKIKELAIKCRYSYIDLHPHFLAGSTLNPEFTYDGVHLTEKGYAKWAELISNELLTD